MSEKDGGPAFPQMETAKGNTVNAEHGEGGMTLRDYFAAHCPNDFIDNACNMRVTQAAKVLGLEKYDAEQHYGLLAAKYAYQYADAMLKEREK